MQKRRGYGFTLVELMIVIVIVSILAAVGYPSYRQYVIKGNRSAAQGFMLQIASREEQYLLDARTYANGATALATLGLTQPPETTGKYTFAITSVSPTADYTITATAAGSQASDGNLALASDGTKTPVDKWK